MSNDQLNAIRANIGGPRTCERWAMSWENQARACDGVNAAECLNNARTLRLAAHVMRSHAAPVLIGGAK